MYVTNFLNTYNFIINKFILCNTNQSNGTLKKLMFSVKVYLKKKTLVNYSILNYSRYTIA